VRDRRGQATFRRALVERYGMQCLISGCSLLDLLEAAHIKPFRGLDDHHISNGLLLRADLHTLYDLDLIGVEPETLTVRLNPAAAHAGYDMLVGTTLRCGSLRPSRAALELRWFEFLARMPRPRG
jgi:predicted restriction endonuclease